MKSATARLVRKEETEGRGDDGEQAEKQQGAIQPPDTAIRPTARTVSTIRARMERRGGKRRTANRRVNTRLYATAMPMSRPRGRDEGLLKPYEESRNPTRRTASNRGQRRLLTTQSTSNLRRGFSWMTREVASFIRQYGPQKHAPEGAPSGRCPARSVWARRDLNP